MESQDALISAFIKEAQVCSLTRTAVLNDVCNIIIETAILNDGVRIRFCVTVPLLVSTEPRHLLQHKYDALVIKKKTLLATLNKLNFDVKHLKGFAAGAEWYWIIWWS